MSPTIETLRANYEAARENAKTDRSFEAREAVKAAWATLDAAVIAENGPVKPRRMTNRAGARQAAERKAERDERLARAAGRRR